MNATARTGLAPLNGVTKFSISLIVGKHHVAESTLSVCKSLLGRIRAGHAKAPEVARPERGVVHAAFRYAAAVHIENREIYRAAMGV